MRYFNYKKLLKTCLLYSKSLVTVCFVYYDNTQYLSGWHYKKILIMSKYYAYLVTSILYNYWCHKLIIKVRGIKVPQKGMNQQRVIKNLLSEIMSVEMGHNSTKLNFVKGESFF